MDKIDVGHCSRVVRNWIGGCCQRVWLYIDFPVTDDILSDQRIKRGWSQLPKAGQLTTAFQIIAYVGSLKHFVFVYFFTLHMVVLHFMSVNPML